MGSLQSNSDQTAEFLRLFSENSRKIYWTVRATVPSLDAADEIFQETSVAIWEKFGEFQVGTNFSAWAFRVAQFKILEYRKRQTRDQKVFGDALVDELVADIPVIAEELDDRRHWLADCFAQLPFPDRDLVTRRYTPGASAKQVAEQLKRSEGYVSKALTRIHRVLFECIARHAADEGGSS